MNDDAQYLRASRAEQHQWRREQWLRELRSDGPEDLSTPDAPGEYGSRRRWND